VSVDGAANQPGVDNNSDSEVELDIQVAGAAAPHSLSRVQIAPKQSGTMAMGARPATTGHPSFPGMTQG